MQICESSFSYFLFTVRCKTKLGFYFKNLNLNVNEYGSKRLYFDVEMPYQIVLSDFYIYLNVVLIVFVTRNLVAVINKLKF